MSSNEPPDGVPEAPPPETPPPPAATPTPPVPAAQPFAPTVREPWINPRKRTSAGLLAGLAALALLGGGIGIGAAAFGGGGDDHGGYPMTYERGDYRMPGPAFVMPRYGWPGPMQGPYAPPRLYPKPGHGPTAAPVPSAPSSPAAPPSHR